MKKFRNKAKIEWNDRDLKTFIDIGIIPSEHICMFEKRFLSRVDTTREPIKRTVQTIIRLKASRLFNSKQRKEGVYLLQGKHGKVLTSEISQLTPGIIQSGFIPNKSQGHTLTTLVKLTL